MLQAADLTIRLHPDDDVVIARSRSRPAPCSPRRTCAPSSPFPPATRSPCATSLRASRCAATTRSSASPRATSRRATTCMCTTSADGRLSARLRFLRLLKTDTVLPRTGDIPGHRARRRPRRHAQLHRHPDQRELLGDGRAHDRRALRRTGWTTTRMSTAWSRSRTRPAAAWRATARASTSCAARWPATRAIPNFFSSQLVGLGCEANQINVLLSAQNLNEERALRRLHHPGEGRHAQGGARTASRASRRCCPKRTR